MFLSLCAVARGADLEVIVSGVRSTEGLIRVAVFNSAETFLITGKEFQKSAFSAAKEAKIVFHGLDAGAYGVAVYHDENSNAIFDKNWLGIPKEGYGFSNNPSVLMRAPRFDEASVKIPENTRLVIALKY